MTGLWSTGIVATWEPASSYTSIVQQGPPPGQTGQVLGSTRNALPLPSASAPIAVVSWYDGNRCICIKPRCR